MNAFIRHLLLTFAVAVFAACSSSAETISKAELPLETIPFARGEVKVTYLGNEGVLIAAKEKKVLIDGLHRKYLDEYAYPPDDLREKLEKAEGEFKGIDLILVSHIHGDHFHAGSVGRLLMNERHAIFATSPQVVRSMEEDFADFQQVKDRIRAVEFEFGKESQFVAAVPVRYLALSHGTGRHASIQNLGHVVEVGLLNFLHIGDADLKDKNFDAFDLENADIDVAFIPYWYLLSKEGRELVDRQFAPKRIIAVHVDVNEAVKIKKELEELDPRIRVFTKILETATF